MQETMKKQHISVAELAKLLGISRIAVFNRIKKGQIPAEKIGRGYAIRIEDVDALRSGREGELTDERKKEIDAAVGKVVEEYGEALRLLGKE